MKKSIVLVFSAALLATSLAAAERSTAEADVAFTYGVRAYNHGDFAEAVRRFQEAVAADPANREAREWLDAAQRRQSQSAAATVAAPGFAGLLALRDQPRFDFRAGLSYGKDSNPAELPDNVIATGSAIGTLRGEVDDKVTNLDLRAAAYPFYGKSGWSLGLTGQLADARFQDLDFLNERQWSAAVHLAWGNDPLGYLTGPLGYTRVPVGASRFSLLLQAGRSDDRLDGDPLVTANEAALALVFRESTTTATQAEFDYQQRDLLDGGPRPEPWSAGVSQLFFLGQRDRYLRLGVLRGEESGGLTGDVTSLSGTAEIALPLTDRLTLQAAASRTRDDLEPTSTLSFSDTTTRAAAELSWRAIGQLYLTGRLSWSKRDSDLAPLPSGGPLAFRDFQRTTATLGLQWIW